MSNPSDVEVERACAVLHDPQFNGVPWLSAGIIIEIAYRAEVKRREEAEECAQESIAALGRSFDKRRDRALAAERVVGAVKIWITPGNNEQLKWALFEYLAARDKREDG